MNAKVFHIIVDAYTGQWTPTGSMRTHLACMVAADPSAEVAHSCSAGVQLRPLVVCTDLQYTAGGLVYATRIDSFACNTTSGQICSRTAVIPAVENLVPNR